MILEDNEIDCQCTCNVICPYCGYEYTHSYELFDTTEVTTIVMCDGCNQKFKAEVEFEPSYYTYKIKAEKAKEGQW